MSDKLDLSFMNVNVGSDVEAIIASYKCDLEAYDIHQLKMKSVLKELVMTVDECSICYISTSNVLWGTFWQCHFCEKYFCVPCHMKQNRGDMLAYNELSYVCCKCKFKRSRKKRRARKKRRRKH